MLLVFHFFEKLAKTSCFAMPFCSFPSSHKRVKDLFRHEFHRFGAFLCQTNGHCKTNGHAISTCARYSCNSAIFSANDEKDSMTFSAVRGNPRLPSRQAALTSRPCPGILRFVIVVHDVPKQVKVRKIR